MNGIIVVNKPKGYTSFDVIAVLRKKLNQKKIGHTGTLDPLATGVLPILLGDTAKFQIFAKEYDKKYIANVKFGITTDTLDTTGKVLSDVVSKVEKEDLEKILSGFVGEINQVPPMFSAIKKNGQKLYNLARKGIEIEREERTVFVKSLNLIEFSKENQTAKLEVLCSKGTYIRSLCADIGAELGCGAVMTELVRSMSNGFDISQSVDLEQLKNTPLDILKQKYILPTEVLFTDLPQISITEAQTVRFRNGANLSLERLPYVPRLGSAKMCKVFSDGEFIGLGECLDETSELKVAKCLHNF